MNKKQLEKTQKIVLEMFQESQNGKKFENAFRTFKQKWNEEKNKQKEEK